MRVFLDCEFDADGLISMGMACDAGTFYEVLRDRSADEWVAANVIPVLNREAIDLTEFRSRLSAYLRQFDAITLVADWPEDIGHFMLAIAEAPDLLLYSGPIETVIDRGMMKSIPDVPHNALSDAVANMREFNARTGDTQPWMR